MIGRTARNARRLPPTVSARLTRGMASLNNIMVAGEQRLAALIGQLLEMGHLPSGDDIKRLRARIVTVREKLLDLEEQLEDLDESLNQ